MVQFDGHTVMVALIAIAEELLPGFTRLRGGRSVPIATESRRISYPVIVKADAGFRNAAPFPHSNTAFLVANVDISANTHRPAHYLGLSVIRAEHGWQDQKG